MTIRDPRSDPQPGDELRDTRDQIKRRVLKREGARVFVDIDSKTRFWVKLASWRRWAAEKEIRIKCQAIDPVTKRLTR
jgi:hypothetical protein